MGGQREYGATLWCGHSLGILAQKNNILPCFISQSKTGPCIYRGDTWVQGASDGPAWAPNTADAGRGSNHLQGTYFPFLRDPEPCSAEAAGQESHCPALASALGKKLQKAWSAAGAANCNLYLGSTSSCLLIYATPVFEPLLSIWQLSGNYSKVLNLADIYEQKQQ